MEKIHYDMVSFNFFRPKLYLKHFNVWQTLATTPPPPWTRVYRCTVRMSVSDLLQLYTIDY